MIVEILVPKVHHTEDLGGANVKPDEGPLISFHYSFVKCLGGRTRVFFSSPSRGVIRGNTQYLKAPAFSQVLMAPLTEPTEIDAVSI